MIIFVKAFIVHRHFTLIRSLCFVKLTLRNFAGITLIATKKIILLVKSVFLKGFFLTGKKIMKLFIKFMVSIRCKMVVKSELKKLGLHFTKVDLGEVEVKEDLNTEMRNELKIELAKSGLELLEDKKAILIERIKNIIIEMVHYSEQPIKTNFSDYLSDKLQHDYTYLANLFSEVTGITIEHYIIAHKIERVKELLLYDELNLTEIAYLLNYSSVAHLSSQFKKVTGLTPTFYKDLKQKRLVTLDKV